MDMMALRMKIINLNDDNGKNMIVDNPALFYTEEEKQLSVVASFTPVQSGTGTPSSENVRPFVGRTSIFINHSNNNVWDEETENTVINNNGTTSDASNRIANKNLIPVREGETYCMVWPKITCGRGAYYDASGNFVQYLDDFPVNTRAMSSQNIGDFTIPSGVRYLKFCTVASYGGTYQNNISINCMGMDSVYHAHGGTNHNISFPVDAGTVYGGKVDATTGRLFVEWGHIASYDGEELPGEWMSDRDVYAAGTTPTTGAEVVYKLAKAVTYNFDRVSITALNGVNYIWADTNSTVQVKYFDSEEYDKIVVMTFNVQDFNGLNEDKDLLEDIIDENSPLLLGLQETSIVSANPIIQMGREIINNRYWASFVGGQYNKTAIATNLSLFNVEYHAFETLSTEARGYQTAEFMFNGKKVFFVNAHLEASDKPSINAAQAMELYNLVSTKESFILIGDFNTDCLNTADSQYISTIKPFVDAGYNLANCSPVNGFIGTWTSGKTEEGTWTPEDNIITSTDFTMSNVRRDTQKITAAGVQDKAIDHVPLICELTL